MKKFFSLILVAMLSLSPIYAFATEDTQALEPTTSETPAEAAEEAPAPEVNTEATTSEAPAAEGPTQSVEEDDETKSETPSTEQLNTDENTDTTSDETKKTKDESSDTKTDEDKKTDETSGKESSDKEKTDLEKESEEELEEDEEKESEEELEEDLEKDKLEEDEEKKDKASIPEHEHEFEYISNKDGTHIAKCIAPVIKENEDGEDGETEEVPCDFELVEECSYNEDGVCVYCGYVKPKEEPKFDPIVSLSISNSSCTINESNPLICMSVSAEDFDIEFAQICFANYGQNKFINVCLAQGRYFDFKANDFVSTGSGSWYASPDITEDYAPGKYSVRSVYIRSTTGEAVHYSVESGNLPDGYQNYSIEVARPTGMSLIRNMFSSSENDEAPAIEEYVPSEDELLEEDSAKPIIETPVEEEPTNTTPIVEQNTEETQPSPAVEEPSVNETPTREVPSIEEPVVEEQPIVMEQIQPEKPIVKEQQKSEEPEITEAPKTNDTTRSTTNNNSNTKQDNTSNSILNFFKKLFGIK